MGLGNVQVKVPALALAKEYATGGIQQSSRVAMLLTIKSIMDVRLREDSLRMER